MSLLVLATSNILVHANIERYAFFESSNTIDSIPLKIANQRRVSFYFGLDSKPLPYQRRE
jgi:hypothetical protein